MRGGRAAWHQPGFRFAPSGLHLHNVKQRSLLRSRARCCAQVLNSLVMSLVGWVERQRNPSPAQRGHRLRWVSRKRSTHPTKLSLRFFAPGTFRARVLFLPLFTFVAAGPRARGLAERREASSLVRVAQVTRDATLARHGPSRATGRPASRRSAVALSAQVPPPSPLPGPARRLHATKHCCQAAVPGFSCPRLPAAVDATSRSAFRIVSGRRPS
jgi:hypothetical protein